MGGGVHLLSWDVIYQLTHEWGPGIQILLAKREALIVIPGARFVLMPISFRSSIIRVKHGPWIYGAEIHVD